MFARRGRVCPSESCFGSFSRLALPMDLQRLATTSLATTTTPAPDAYWKGMMHGMIVALTCLTLWALTNHCYRCCSCRAKKGSKVIFCRDVSTMSQTTYLARHRYDPVRGYEGDVEVKKLYLKGEAGHSHSG